VARTRMSSDQDT